MLRIVAHGGVPFDRLRWLGFYGLRYAGGDASGLRMFRRHCRFFKIVRRHVPMKHSHQKSIMKTVAFDHEPSEIDKNG